MQPLTTTQANRPKLALFGGAFNPPTLGHVAVVERLVRAGFERVLVMPCFGHTFGKSLAPAADRLVLAMEAFRHLPEARVSSFEIDLGMNGSTYELVSKLPLLPEYRTHDIFLAIGSDEANVLHRWRRHEELRSMIRFVVITRAGHPLSEGGRWATHAPHLVISHDGTLRDTSSTAVRAAIASGDFETAQHALTPRILEHIRERRLYHTLTAA